MSEKHLTDTQQFTEPQILLAFIATESFSQKFLSKYVVLRRQTIVRRCMFHSQGHC